MYILMLSLQKYRPIIALSGAALFVILGLFGVYNYSISDAILAVDYNVLLMITGTVGIVTLFINSKMPARLSEPLPIFPLSVFFAKAVKQLSSAIFFASVFPLHSLQYWQDMFTFG